MAALAGAELRMPRPASMGTMAGERQHRKPHSLAIAAPLFCRGVIRSHVTCCRVNDGTLDVTITGSPFLAVDQLLQTLVATS
jgi:hypothetical protein